MQPPIGTLVAPTPTYRESMGTGEGGAVLLALRRGSGQLYYPGSDRMFWVPTRQIGPIPPEVFPDECLERVLSGLLLFLNADECVLETVSGDTWQLAIEIPALSREGIEELRGMLGERLADFAFEAGSMRHVLLRMTLRSLPPAAGAVR